ncbi:MAG: hypothetical protein IKM26_01285 [Clostridia bacterium]|nr:hypothetical protein [Clostridia bacterium]
MKDKLKKAAQFLLNPHLVICLAIAWMITNGWSYVLFALGTLFEINWMTVVAGAYLAFLWIPFTPEKLITFTIAIALLRWLFPNDQKTLAVLRRWYDKAKNAVRRKCAEHQEKKKEKENHLD